EDRNLIVATKSGEDYETVLTAETALKRNRWQHVALTVDFSIESSFQNQTRVRFDVTLYLDGVVAGAAAAIEHGALERSANAMFGVLGKRLLRGCVLGSRVDDREAFAGRFTELRFWRGVRSAEAIAELFRRRARGDEPGLAACYRLDGIDDGRLLDCGPARAHAIAGSGVNTPGATNAPVPATAGSHVGRVDVRDRLRKEWLPKAAFSSADLREILDRDGVVGELGTVNGARVETSIYELVLRPVDGNGAAVDTAVIYLEETQVAIVSDVSGPPRTEQWAKGYHLIPTGSSGEARLRFVARGLASSRVYVRHAGMHNRVWTPLAPDRRNADKLMAVRPERLLGLESSPTTGGTTTGGTTTGGTAASVLSPTATMADAVAATNMIRAMARVGLSPSAAGSQPTSGGGDFLGMGDYFEDISGAVEDGGKAAFQAVKSAASLASDVGLDLAKILEEAPVYMGKQAVENCIATAEQLRVLASPAAELVNVVQIVGERWVDGVKQSFRVLVREFEEAWAAIDAFFTRIGGKIRDFINMLADALDWSKFLATADRVYGEILGAFEEVEASVADQLPANGESTSAWASRLAGELGSGLDPLRAWSPSAVSFQAALTRPLPVVDASQIPGYDEVTWLMDKLTELMKSAKFKLSLPTLDIGDALPDWLDELVEAAPSLDFAGDPLGIDMVTLVQTLVDLWDRLIDNLLKDVWKPILKLVQGAVSGIQAGLTERINIPFLTELIESTVLGGRELNMLRMLSLVGAVPLRLWEIAQGVAAGGGGQGGGGGIDAGGIASGVISIFNSLATATRTLPGLDIPEGLYQAQFGTAHGALIIVQGILDAALNFGRLPAVGGFVNVFYGIATTALGGGSWFAMNQGYYYENGLDKTTEKLLTRIDVLAGLAWFGLSAIEWGTKGDQGIDPWKESGYWAAAYFVMGTGRVASKSKHPLASVVTLEMAIAALLLNLGYMTDTIVDLGRAN
ncbi:MAG: LamG-like jellyroll fold domain-containing protein, partial [Nannocystaceae bacterium]